MTLFFEQEALIEILCNLVALQKEKEKGIKREKTLEALAHPMSQKEVIKHFTKKKHSRALAETVFLGKIPPNGKCPIPLPNLCYELQNGINNGGICGISKTQFENINELFITEKNPQGLAVEYICQPEFNPQIKDQFLSGTIMYQYFKDKETQENGETIWGVTRTIFYFEPFGKIRLRSFNADELHDSKKRNDQQFVGNYKLYGANKEYLSIKVHHVNEPEKEIIFNFYVTTSKRFEFATGLWTMPQNNKGGISILKLLYDKEVSVERTAIEANIQPNFMRFDDPDLPTEISDFFATAKSSYTKIGKEIREPKHLKKLALSLKRNLESDI